jgi:hypothetical protein
LSGHESAGREVLTEAMARQERLLELGDEDYRPLWHLSAAPAALGDDNAALNRLEESYEAGFRFARWLPIDPAFDRLRGHPRYREIMDDLEEHVDTMRERVIEGEPRSGIRH